MKVLVTGGGGFIGSALCNKLSQLGHQVVSFDNFSRKSHINTTDYPYETFVGDIRDINDLTDCVHKYNGFDSLYHLAYINGTSTFYTHPELVLDVGVKGAINTLDIALHNDIKNYILVSTSEVYNEPTQVPTPEDERILIPDVHNPRFSYSGGKIISELLAIHYGAKQGLNVKILRPHNVYGSNMGFEHVIPEIIKKIVSPIDPTYDDGALVVNIQGSGKETRAFCFIDDAIDEIILVGINDSSEFAPIYNIGVEDETTIIDLVTTIAGLLDVKIIIKSSIDKTVGSSNRRCPLMKKMTLLGHKPQYTLYEGLEKTVTWYKDFYLNEKV
jgi:nucleoside-diphosphate-sugar epimerase